MYLEITNTFSRLGSTIEYPYLKLSQGLASFQLNQEKPELKIETHQGQLVVDGRVAQEDIGIYTPLEIGNRHYQKYWEHGLTAIGEMAADGDYLAMIERGHTIPHLVKERSTPAEKEINIHFKRGAQIMYTPGGVTFTPQLGRLSLVTKPYSPEKTFRPGQVSFYHLQRGGVQIQVRGERLDTTA